MLVTAMLVVTQATLTPTWSVEPFPVRSSERIAYVTFVSEREILFASNHGLLQWLDAKNGKELKRSRVGGELLSGIRVGDDLWFRTPHPHLVRVPLRTPEQLSTVSMGSPWEYVLSDGSPFAMISRAQKPIQVINLTNGKTEMTIARDPTHSVWYGAGSHRTGKVAIVASQVLTVWDVNTGKPMRKMGLPLGDLTDIRFTPDDRQIAITYRDWLGTVFYDMTTFTRVTGIKGTQFHPVFAPTVVAMANSGYGGYLRRQPRIWDVSSGTSWQLDVNVEAISLAFSPSSRRIVFAWGKKLSLYAVPASISKGWSF